MAGAVEHGARSPAICRLFRRSVCMCRVGWRFRGSAWRWRPIWRGSLLRANDGQWRYLGWLLLFSAVSEIPYRMYIPDPDTLNVLPTLALGLLVARGWQQPVLASRLLAVGALLLAGFFSAATDVRFLWRAVAAGDAAGDSAALVFQRCCRGWSAWRPINGRCCITPLGWATSRRFSAIATCLIAPWLGLFLLRHAKGVNPPPMRRWAYALYPAAFPAVARSAPGHRLTLWERACSR